MQAGFRRGLPLLCRYASAAQALLEAQSFVPAVQLQGARALSSEAAGEAARMPGKPAAAPAFPETRSVWRPFVAVSRGSHVVYA
jgi:hypothetical protein